MQPPRKRPTAAIAVVTVTALLIAFVSWERHRFMLTVRNETEGETVTDIAFTLGYDKASIETLAPGETVTLTDLRLAGDTPLEMQFRLGKRLCAHENESVVRAPGHRIEIEIRSCFTVRSRSAAWPSIWTTAWTKTPPR